MKAFEERYLRLLLLVYKLHLKFQRLIICVTPVAMWLSQQSEKEEVDASMILSVSSWNLFRTVLLLIIMHHLHKPQKQTPMENDLNPWHIALLLITLLIIHLLETKNIRQMIHVRLTEDTHCNTINRTESVTQNFYLSNCSSLKHKFFSYASASWFLSLGFTENLKDYENSNNFSHWEVFPPSSSSYVAFTLCEHYH